MPKLRELLALPAEERLALAEALWLSLEAESSLIPVPDWHRQLLDERIAADNQDEGPGETWTDLRRRLEAKG
ncbi:MAG: addiction module protein [Hyphomicrobiaceae bacterium]|nr:addiction module protein [Hyphomicrobiaceae bacterium]